jgi:hypothetical protein
MTFIVYVAGVHGASESIAANRYAYPKSLY